MMHSDAFDMQGDGRGAIPERYEVISPLGAGGMARVYLALHRGPFGASKLVVLKQLRAEIASDPQYRNMFADEARLALRFNHPNVVHTYEVVDEPGVFFLAMEFLEGRSLSQLLAKITRERMPIDEHLWILTQVLAGLHYAHTLADFDGTPLRVVHRDVSPSNVFVTYTGEVKILDFGIAKVAGAVAETQLGMIKGKIGYAAPEQCVAEPVDARSDVYAVGVMLWEALARRRRSVGDTSMAVIQARLLHAEPNIEDVVADLPPDLVRITRRALAVNPAQRFSSALEMQLALEAYLRRRGFITFRERVTKLMVTHFTDELVALRQLIGDRVGSRGRVSRSSIPDRPGAASEVSTQSITPPGASGSVMQIAQAARQARRRWLAYGITGILATTLGGLGARYFAVGSSNTAANQRAVSTQVVPTRISASAPAERATPSPDSNPLAAAGSASASGAPTSSAGTPADTANSTRKVQLSITVTPKHALVRVDGKLVSTPFHAPFDVTGEKHTISADAAGFIAEKRVLVLDREVNLNFQLRPSPAEGVPESAPSSGRTASPVASADEQPSPAPAEVVTSVSPPPSPAPPARLEPGEDLRRSPSESQSRKSRGIDPNDPYGL
ncbi:MAG TPA: serine/threonine-protein kinase [Polyangiaceae bacterium]|nr:serine/threonine-protein kinase [Polyangiaceae bacterium]